MRHPWPRDAKRESQLRGRYLRIRWRRLASPVSHYDQLLAKADAFFSAVEGRGADLRCGEGCSACCHAELSVSRVEADSIRNALRASEQREELRARAASDTQGECVMLINGRCAVYAARPLVCRTQGLPLAYPAGVVPEEAVRARGHGVEVTWCPLNFTVQAPAREDILGASVLDEALVLVNRAHCDAMDADPLERLSLREIAAEP